MTEAAVIVTNCTQRKSVQARIDLAQLPQVHEVKQLAEAWRRQVGRASPVALAQSVYQGRSIVDTAATAAFLGSSWYVVSAGLGLVRSDQPVPAYECTVAANSELGTRLRRSGATSMDWWNAITAASRYPLSRLIAESPTLLALPSSYLHLVHDDLARLSATKAEQLRIFTSRAGARFVPEHLAECIMPYDERLESLRPYAGTRSDFAQRALRHFVEALLATSLSLADSRVAVSAALAGQQRPLRQRGRRMSDEEIQRVLRLQWASHEGSSARLLRHLRDVAHIACEQGRFSRIWQALAAELRS